jgi:hypothetical protein
MLRRIQQVLGAMEETTKYKKISLKDQKYVILLRDKMLKIGAFFMAVQHVILGGKSEKKFE